MISSGLDVISFKPNFQFGEIFYIFYIFFLNFLHFYYIFAISSSSLNLADMAVSDLISMIFCLT